MPGWCVRLYEAAKARLEAEAAEAAEQQRILDLLYQVLPSACMA